MAHALTEHYEKVIDRLIRLGVFANRSEVVRAGLKELEEKYLREDYLNPPPLPKGSLARAYRKQRGEEPEPKNGRPHKPVDYDE
ncbi:MAG TPA: type II toxin-antitoxin system ParD family antitoxin [Candidatus Angelobacter sp.]|nr:type II toxin-antitoxin system ParD family antitoxin [Candidatus Angelobacter sp.]